MCVTTVCQCATTAHQSQQHKQEIIDSERYMAQPVLTYAIRSYTVFIRRKPVLTHASIVCGGMLASVNSVDTRNIAHSTHASHSNH